VRVTGWGSKTELEQIGFPANETVGLDAGNVLRRFVLRSMAEEKSSVRKCRGGVEDDTLFISLLLQYYRLCALLHAIPPPWGSHLSQYCLKAKQNKQHATVKSDI